MLQPRPNIYKNILIFGGKSKNEPTIGGWARRPNLPLSYLLAGRHVIERAEADERLAEIALPAAYLQRHALELFLKDALSACYEIKRDTEWLKRLQKNRRAAPPAQTDTVPPWHGHGDLRKLLVAALKEVGFGPLPRIVTTLCARMTRAEAKAPERFRYDMVEFNKKRGKRGKRPKLKHAFRKRETLEIVATQNAMEAMVETVFLLDDAAHRDTDPRKKYNLWTRLSLEAHGLGSIIAQNYTY